MEARESGISTRSTDKKMVRRRASSKRTQGRRTPVKKLVGRSGLSASHDFPKLGVGLMRRHLGSCQLILGP
eukprot:2640752-Pyramimonas_sp.AAC.1